MLNNPIKAQDALKDPEFIKAMETMLKGYIDKQFASSGKEVPEPTRLIPLEYENAELNKAVARLRMGAQINAFCFDKYVANK